MNPRRFLLFLLLTISPLAFALQETSSEPGSQADEPGSQAREPGSQTGDEKIPPELLPVPEYNSPSTEKEEQKEWQGDDSNLFFEMIGNLLLVLGLMLLLAWLAKKFLPHKLGALGESKQLRLLQSLPLGPRRYVSLIEADGKRFLLGVTDTQVNLLKALDEIPFEQALSAMDSPQTVAELMEQEP